MSIKSKSTAVIAIDPGIHGAIALLIEGDYGDVCAMPFAPKRSGRNEVEVHELFDIVDDMAGRAEITRVLIERVSAMPGQGVSSMFSLGDSFGTARAVGSYFGHQVDFVMPHIWKKAMGLTKDKEYSRTLARNAFPLAREKLKRKKDEGLAEALLLARYGYRTHKW